MPDEKTGGEPIGSPSPARARGFETSSHGMPRSSKEERTSIPLAERKALTASWNAGVKLAAEIRRSAGPRTATKALPIIFDKLGIPIDLTISDTLAQSEFDLPI